MAKRPRAQRIAPGTKIPSQAPVPTHAAVPLELFRALRQTIGNLPHDQVRGLLDRLDQNVRAITMDDVPTPTIQAPQEEPVE